MSLITVVVNWRKLAAMSVRQFRVPMIYNRWKQSEVVDQIVLGGL